MSRMTRRVDALQDRVNGLEDTIVKCAGLMVRLGEQVVAMASTSTQETKLVQELIEGMAQTKGRP